jgi:UDP-GlcNAc:undecaprenyl-phosphate GlcNAc-1-phosphate transferase
VLGLLIHNFKPAKIYAGDNGSLFIGYMMAAFTLLGTYRSHSGTYITSFIPILIFGVPIYDTLSVIVVRLARGIPPWRGDRNHFAHRLVKIGMSDKVAVIFSYFIQSTTGLVAVLMTQVTLLGAVLIGFVFVLIIGVVAFLEFYTTEKIRAMEKLMDKKKKTQERGVI